MKWIIIFAIIILAAMVGTIYYLTFYRKKTYVKSSKALGPELISIDKYEKNWVLFHNSHVQNKKNSQWLLFDGIIITDTCMYFINDISALGNIIEEDLTNEEWKTHKGDIPRYFNNPINNYEKLIKILFKQLNVSFETKIILIRSNQSYDLEFSRGFSLRIDEIKNLREKIKTYENRNSFEGLISMSQKREFMYKLQMKADSSNKKNISRESDSLK